MSDSTGRSMPVIIVQGGAGAYIMVDSDNIKKNKVNDGVIEAAKAGYTLLRQGGYAIDAVQAAVTALEDNPIFNCGYGSYLTNSHTIEMDASIMDGATLETGAVACITNVRNPILVARAVMNQTPHNMFCGSSATDLARTFGFDAISTDDLTTEKARSRLKSRPVMCESSKEGNIRSSPRHPNEHDTVGAVAIDRHGNVAYATSTGGISGKMCGRVGDSPIVGCGGYADNKSGAVSTTGDGEAFMKLCTAKHVAILMEQGQSPQSAVEEAIESLENRLSGSGGCVAVNHKGEIGIHFNSAGMSWTVIKDDIIHYGLYKGEDNTKALVG